VSFCIINVNKYPDLYDSPFYSFVHFIKNNINLFKDRVFVYSVSTNGDHYSIKIPEDIWKKMPPATKKHYASRTVSFSKKRERFHLLTFVDIWEKKRLDKL